MFDQKIFLATKTVRQELGPPETKLMVLRAPDLLSAKKMVGQLYDKNKANWVSVLEEDVDSFLKLNQTEVVPEMTWV